MRAAIDQGHNILCKLGAIKEVLADLEERTAALRRCLPSSELCEEPFSLSLASSQRFGTQHAARDV
jgi:hypothetical protein